MKKEKRGQITVFIIIGLVLLLGTAVVIYIYSQTTTTPIKRTVSVPEELQQIYDYVETCLNQVSKEGLILIGAQGGYIEVPPVISRNRNAYVPADPFETIKTPYWYYENEDRTPTLDFIQRELSIYVKQNMPACVDFKSFEPQYQITPKSDILPVITFTDTQTMAEIKWQLQIQSIDKQLELKEFVTTHDVKLKPAHELATKIMQTENEQGWFENLTIDLMSANPRIPMSGLDFFCGTKKWHIRDVKAETQTMLYYNLPTVRVENTQYPAPIESIKYYQNLKKDATTIRTELEEGQQPKWPQNTPEDTFEMNRMMFYIGTPKTQLKTNFQYLSEWPFLINAQPNQGGILSSAQMKGPKKYLRFLCLNQYHFAYDLIYPIKTTIRDDTAFNGEGYNYNFAFPVVIQDNEESRKVFGLRKFQTPDEGIDFCDTIGTQTIDLRVKGFEEGIPTAVELEGANITYRCISKECTLGTTYSDGTATRLTAYLPQGCSNPTIIAKKEGYLEGKQQATPQMEILLTKLKKFNYTIMVHPYFEEVDKQDPMKITTSKWLEAENYNKLTKTMHATISLTIRNETYDQYFDYPTDNQLELIYGDATYDLDIILFKGENIVGGYHAENITITYDDVAMNNNMILHAVEYRPMPMTKEQETGMYMFLYDRGKYTDGTQYNEALKPTLVP